MIFMSFTVIKSEYAIGLLRASDWERKVAIHKLSHDFIGNMTQWWQEAHLPM